ncbi:hypothetical protein JDV02_008226 [Purpureocillium takamizusanense]|uniref:MARVEL domain-containing protein n=1 Tax=Purpureocillium takamizusanense TaxID=2060973 RepID=A0A9Q8QPU3_9HYPO|nr:uncharacterized protein JDV02_008226 [Purpureocillium takamizusanense]UNI22327.1 hypothetical protein JDV02_008226 [Purpureocillium takamizusanense]
MFATCSKAIIVKPRVMSPFRLRIVQALLLGLEVVVAVTLLALFGFAYSNHFRSGLWEEGGAQEWNSDPRLRIYFYANHREPPEIPLIWSQRLAASNLSIAVLTVFVLVTRLALLRLSYMPEYTSILYDLLLFSLWAISLAGQSSGDYSDPKHICAHPWYLIHGCAKISGQNRAYCRLAQAGFAFTLLALAIYGSRLLLSAYGIVKARDSQKEYEDLAWGAESSDLEWASEREEKRRWWLDQPLSPVLAFFPETSR